MSSVLSLLWRDIVLALRLGGGGGNGLAFFVLTVVLVPLGIGPETGTLARIAPGVLWIARGDESELLEWVRPASDVLRSLARTRPRIVIVDRTSTARAIAARPRPIASEATSKRSGLMPWRM